MRNTYKILLKKSQGKRQLGTYKHRQQDIKMYVEVWTDFSTEFNYYVLTNTMHHGIR